MSEVPTYQPPEGVHGPTLGRDLPDGCEWLTAYMAPHEPGEWSTPAHDGCPVGARLYWWRFPPLKVGDRVQLTGTVAEVDRDGCHVVVVNDLGGSTERWFPSAALTRVVDK